MKINVLTAAAALSDRELLDRLAALAGQERATSAELIAHLAVLDARPALYAAQGFGSLFSYCTGALRLSEDAACSRIEAARACGQFPVALDLLASGALTLTALRLLRPHLTPQNHQAVLTRASGRSGREIESLVAELAPRPDVRSTVRRLPAIESPAPPVASSTTLPVVSPPDVVDAASSLRVAGAIPATVENPAPSSEALPEPRIAADRPIVRETSPERYRVQFTIGAETHAKLRRLQTLLRREIPSGDPAVLFDRAVSLLLETVEKKKLAAAVRPRTRRSIRPGTDTGVAGRSAVRETSPGVVSLTAALRTPIVQSLHVSSAVKRAVLRRDAAQCAFVGPAGQRCPERAFLEFHHVEAYARHGEGTVANISLRCRRHNQYEAELVFGPRRDAKRPPRPHAPE